MINEEILKAPENDLSSWKHLQIILSYIEFGKCVLQVLYYGYVFRESVKKAYFNKKCN